MTGLFTFHHPLGDIWSCWPVTSNTSARQVWSESLVFPLNNFFFMSFTLLFGYKFLLVQLHFELRPTSLLPLHNLTALSLHLYWWSWIKSALLFYIKYHLILKKNTVALYFTPTNLSNFWLFFFSYSHFHTCSFLLLYYFCWWWWWCIQRCLKNI